MLIEEVEALSSEVMNSRRMYVAGADAPFSQIPAVGGCCLHLAVVCCKDGLVEHIQMPA